MLKALIDWLKEPEQEGLRRAFVVWFKQVFLLARMPGAKLPELQDLQEVRTMLARTGHRVDKAVERRGSKGGQTRGHPGG